MDYRTIDDMYERGTLVRLTDLWTPNLVRYRDRPAVVIDIEVWDIRARSADRKTVPP